MKNKHALSLTKRMKLKLLMVGPYAEAKGGIYNNLYKNLAEYLGKKPNYDIRLFSYGSIKDDKEFILVKFINTFRHWVNFIIICLTFKPHLIQFHSAFGYLSLLRDIPFMMVCKALRISIFHVIHGSHQELLCSKSILWQLLKRLFLLFPEKIGVLTNIERLEFGRQLKVDEAKLIVVKEICNSPVGLGEIEVVQKVPGKIYGLFVSRFVEKKGIYDLIKALPELFARVNDLRFMFVGDGAADESARKLARDLGVNDKIIWSGYIPQSQVQALYGESEFLVFPTHYPEGMPIVILEAMRAKLPIITTRTRFAEEYCKENINCVFIERGNPNDIVDKVMRLLGDEEMQMTMKRENLALVENFCVENVGREFERVYACMLRQNKLKDLYIKEDVE